MMDMSQISVPSGGLPNGPPESFFRPNSFGAQDQPQQNQNHGHLPSEPFLAPLDTDSTWDYPSYSSVPSSLSDMSSLSGLPGVESDTTRAFPTTVQNVPESLPDHLSFAMSPSAPLQRSQVPITVDTSFMSFPGPVNRHSVSPNQAVEDTPYGAFTALSPMLSNHYNSTPPRTSFTNAATSIGAMPRPGPVRGYSFGSAIPTRRRSSTLMAPSPITPSYHTYPYPSPRSYLSSAPPIQSLFRQPSAPLLITEARKLHPSPAGVVPYLEGDMGRSPMGGDDVFLRGIASAGIGEFRTGMGMSMGGGCSKPPRFKPTKEQLNILIKSYDENKNPDSATREALAQLLGADVRPKTLQIWFQNRRSKARTKERAREASSYPSPTKQPDNPRSYVAPTSSTPTGLSASSGICEFSTNNGTGDGTISSIGDDKPNADLESLRGLFHDDDPHMTPLPITVLSISSWTRFLTPGTGSTHPDLAASIRFPSDTSPASHGYTHGNAPTLHLYVLHSHLLRIDIPLVPMCIANLQAASNPTVNTDAIAIRFELSPRQAMFMGWTDHLAGNETGSGEWVEVGDFTGGVAGNGGRVEITGIGQVLLPIFSRVQQSLANAYPTPITSSSSLNAQLIPHTIPIPVPSPINAWRFPSDSSTSTSSPKPGLYNSSGLDAESPMVGYAHQRQRSFSQPPPFPQSQFSYSMLGQPQAGAYLPPHEMEYASMPPRWSSSLPNFEAFDHQHHQDHHAYCDLDFTSTDTSYIQTPISSHPTSSHSDRSFNLSSNSSTVMGLNELELEDVMHEKVSSGNVGVSGDCDSDEAGSGGESPAGRQGGVKYGSVERSVDKEEEEYAEEKTPSMDEVSRSPEDVST